MNLQWFPSNLHIHPHQSANVPHPLNLASCFFLTSWLCSFNYLSCGDVIYGTSYLCSFSCLSYGHVIYGTFVVYLTACTIVGTACTTIGTTNGSTLPLIIFCVLTSMLSYSLFTLEPKAPPSSTLCFLLKTLLGKFVAAFFLFSSVVYISSLVLLTLVDGFCAQSTFCLFFALINVITFLLLKNCIFSL